MIPYTIGLLGMWLFQDGWFSIVTTQRLGVNNRFWFDHSIRIIRIVVGIVLMVLASILLAGDKV